MLKLWSAVYLYLCVSYVKMYLDRKEPNVPIFCFVIVSVWTLLFIFNFFAKYIFQLKEIVWFPHLQTGDFLLCLLFVFGYNSWYLDDLWQMKVQQIYLLRQNLFNSHINSISDEGFNWRISNWHFEAERNRQVGTYFFAPSKYQCHDRYVSWILRRIFGFWVRSKEGSRREFFKRLSCTKIRPRVQTQAFKTDQEQTRVDQTDKTLPQYNRPIQCGWSVRSKRP